MRGWPSRNMSVSQPKCADHRKMRMLFPSSCCWAMSSFFSFLEADPATSKTRLLGTKSYTDYTQTSYGSEWGTQTQWLHHPRQRPTWSNMVCSYSRISSIWPTLSNIINIYYHILSSKMVYSIQQEDLQHPNSPIDQLQLARWIPLAPPFGHQLQGLPCLAALSWNWAWGT